MAKYVNKKNGMIAFAVIVVIIMIVMVSSARASGGNCNLQYDSTDNYAECVAGISDGCSAIESSYLEGVCREEKCYKQDIYLDHTCPGFIGPQPQP